jgi:GxxExxY protein
MLVISKPSYGMTRESALDAEGSTPEGINEISRRVIGAAIEVHRCLGPGLMESTYQRCLAHELRLREMRFTRELPVPIVYKGLELEDHYRLDFMIENQIIVEVKTLTTVLPIHEAQVLTYLRLMDRWLGLLINFHSTVLFNGVHRLVNKKAGGFSLVQLAAIKKPPPSS